MAMSGSDAIEAYLATLPARPAVTPLRSPHGTNVLARLDDPDGRATVVKVYRKESAARNEEAALRAVAAACTEAEVPHVRHFGEVAGHFVMEMTCVPGRVPTITHDAAGHALARRLGALLRRVHRARVPGGGWGALWTAGDAPAVTWEVALRERFFGRIGRLVDDGALDRAAAAAAAALVDAAGPRLAEYTAPDLVHGDLNASNLLVRDDGSVGLIDFERARAGHWVYDTVKLFSETFGGCPACIAAFTEGYGVRAEAIRDDARVYRLVYSVDMAAYLLDELHTAEDRALLGRLLAFVRRPDDPWAGG